MQEFRIVPHKALCVDQPRQLRNIAPFDVLDIEPANTRPFLNIGNRQPLLLALSSQDVSDHETPSLTFVTFGIYRSNYT